MTDHEHSLSSPKTETKRDYYGVALSIDSKVLENTKQDSLKHQHFDKVVDILVVVDGQRREMTLEEFKERIFTNKR